MIQNVNAAWFVMTRLARDRSALIGLVLIALLVLAAVLAPVLATHPDDVFELHPSERLKEPSGAHWLGTDRMGADVYSRLLFGARITILIGVIAGLKRAPNVQRFVPKAKSCHLTAAFRPTSRSN